MKLKIIQLLNKIANNEDLPKNIEYYGQFFEYDINHQRYEAYFDEQIWTLDDFIKINNDRLNDEIEIIEEDKKIEKIDSLNTDYYSKEVYYERLSKEEITLDIQTLKHWINKIIDRLNKGE